MVLRTKVGARAKRKETHSWSLQCNLLSMGSSCAANPLLFIGVSGHEQFFRDSAPRRNQIFFLFIDLQRVGEQPLLTYLPSDPDFKVGNSGNISQSFLDIGIDSDRLTNIRPACLMPNEPYGYANIKMDIEIPDSHTSCMLSSDCSSVSYEEALHCCKTRVYTGDALRDLPCEFTAWTDCRIRKVGRFDQVEFQVEGSWFRVSGSLYSELNERIKADRNLVCLVKRHSEKVGMEYQICGSRPAPPRDSRSATKLPVQDEPMIIISAMYAEKGKTLQVSLDGVGSFYIPKSIVEAVKLLCPSGRDFNSFVAEELVGCQVVHNESNCCHVKANTNKEEIFSILDKSGILKANNIPSHTLKRGATDPQPASETLRKRQRTM